ncbi:hypothetical protein VNO77_47964 [Canavalia gladiata]|uniref:Uncharacterized protein n=1 Tax=Canavalia gladiata TaxID=3824 RepID=A0AAN9JH75_CANGL
MSKNQIVNFKIVNQQIVNHWRNLLMWRNQITNFTHQIMNQIMNFTHQIINLAMHTLSTMDSSVILSCLLICVVLFILHRFTNK